MSVPNTLSGFMKRLPILFLGYFLCAIGIVSNLYANLGTAPWDVLHVGFTNVTPLTLGQVSQLVGLAIVIISWVLGFAPGFGTLANMFFIGFFVDLIVYSNFIPVQTQFVWQIIQLVASIAITGIGAFLYLRTQLGAGPRDGLMVALTKALDKPVFYVRVPMDVSVSIIGYFLGGPLGAGTVLTALSLGYFMQFFFKVGKFDSKSKHLNLIELIQIIHKNKRHKQN